MSAQSRGLLALVGALGAALALTASAQAQPTAKPVCTLSAAATLESVLEHTRERLTHRKSLTIVAIGSSSTWGAGAKSAAAAYPARLEAYLKEKFRGVAIRVINRGVNGEEEADMMARFDKDVIAEHPDLVLWQVGANAVMRNRAIGTEQTLMRDGIDRLKSIGADVVLVDIQYTPAVIAKASAAPMVDLIASEAREHEIGVFRRFDVMKDWHETHHLPFNTFSVADGLHMNDWGYDCFARNLAAAIVDASAPPAMASAKTGSVH
jgi:lysophospholipase L1-like esterase